MSDLDKLLDAVNELTEPRTHEEPYTYRHGSTWITTRHRTSVPSLIQQLEGAMKPGGVGDTGSRVFGSRTPARDDAMDVLMLIDTAAWIWCDHAGLTCRPSTVGNLRALLGITGSLDSDQAGDLAYAARSWVALARVTTGWDKPAFSPAENTCPLCAQRGGLRIRVGDGIYSTDATAACLNCHEHWDNSNIGLLAAHIRTENDELEESA